MTPNTLFAVLATEASNARNSDERRRARIATFAAVVGESLRVRCRPLTATALA